LTRVARDYAATVEFARASFKRDVTRMAITGFCRGGRTTLVYASANPRLKAAVAWYGPVGGQKNDYTPRTAMERVAEIKVPTLGLYGGKDAGIPVDQVEKFFAALQAAGTPSSSSSTPRPATASTPISGGRYLGRDAEAAEEDTSGSASTV
jgi:dienelactone hydrolase